MSKNKQDEIFHEEKKEKTKIIIKRIIKLTFIFIVTATLFFTYTTYISTVKIGVREYRIKNTKIKEEFNGLKIIQISDLHYGSTMFLDDVKKIKKLSNERKPDIVVFTGDLISKNKKLTKEEQEKLTKELKEITATLGKYAILGDEDKENISTIYNQSDFLLLKNQYELIYVDNNNPILLIGLSSSLTDSQNIEEAYQYFSLEQHNAEIFTLTLLHEPDSVDDIINTYPTDLFLAGHSHNGNIRIPIINKAIIKQKGAEKYDQAYYKLENTELFISSGLGTQKGIRLFSRPSINFFRLSQK